MLKESAYNQYFFEKNDLPRNNSTKKKQEKQISSASANPKIRAVTLSSKCRTPNIPKAGFIKETMIVTAIRHLYFKSTRCLADHKLKTDVVQIIKSIANICVVVKENRLLKKDLKTT